MEAAAGPAVEAVVEAAVVASVVVGSGNVVVVLEISGVVVDRSLEGSVVVSVARPQGSHGHDVGRRASIDFACPLWPEHFQHCLVSTNEPRVWPSTVLAWILVAVGMPHGSVDRGG